MAVCGRTGAPCCQAVSARVRQSARRGSHTACDHGSFCEPRDQTPATAHGKEGFRRGRLDDSARPDRSCGPRHVPGCSSAVDRSVGVGSPAIHRGHTREARKSERASIESRGRQRRADNEVAAVENVLPLGRGAMADLQILAQRVQRRWRRHRILEHVRQQRQRLIDFWWARVWLSDSQRLLFPFRDRIYLVNASSRRFKEVASIGAFTIQPYGLSASRDNRWLYYAVQMNEADVWLMQLPKADAERQSSLGP